MIYTANLETFKKRQGASCRNRHPFFHRIGRGLEDGMRLFRTSQDTFLRRYRYETEERLDSYMVAEKITDNRYYRVKASDTQGLRETDTPDKEPSLLPEIYL